MRFYYATSSEIPLATPFDYQEWEKETGQPYTGGWYWDNPDGLCIGPFVSELEARRFYRDDPVLRMSLPELRRHNRK